MAWHRRDFLLTGAGVTGAALAASASIARGSSRLDLNDPAAALASYVKLRGSIGAETVFQAYEGDIFLVADGRVGIPLLGFKGIQKSLWQPDGMGGFTNRDYDVGLYVDYRTREVLKTWVNPLTQRAVGVYHYRGGPTGGHFKVGETGGDVYGDHGGRWSMVGDQVWHTSNNWGERPNPMKPAEWPLASSGETLLGSMSLTFAGRVADLADPRVKQAPALQVWTNVTSWMPWMEMGRQPGANMWRWTGAKGVRREDLDPALVAGVESVWPGYVRDNAVWSEPTSGRNDYMRLKRGLPVTQ